MTEKSQPDLSSQFQELGENIKTMFQSAWESDEAQKLKEDLRIGFDELGKAAVQAVEDFNMSETGQTLKTEAEELKSRVESGELETKARQEISKALEMINAELQKAIKNFTSSNPDSEV